MENIHHVVPSYSEYGINSINILRGSGRIIQVRREIEMTYSSLHCSKNPTESNIKVRRAKNYSTEGTGKKNLWGGWLACG